MSYALSTQGQGSTSFITVPSWTRPASSDWMVGITCKIFTLSAIQHLLGRSNSTAGSLRVLTDGALRYRDATDLITSAAGLISVDTYFTAVVRRVGSVIELWVGPESMDETLSGGTKIGDTTTLTSAIFNPLNQIGRFSTTARSDIEVKKFWTVGGTYTDEADATTATGSGVNWPFVSASRNLTITNATGATDSWWISYGSSGDQKVDLSSLSSTAVLYSPIVTKDKLINLNSIGSTVTTYSPTVTKAKLVSLNAIGATTVVRNPTVLKELRITPVFITSTALVQTPSVVKSGALTLTPETIGSTAVVRVPAISKDKLVMLPSIPSVSIVRDPAILTTKVINLGNIGSSLVMYDHEILGGYTPVPDVVLYPAEGYGLHIRSAREMQEVIQLLAKRLAILEGRSSP